MTPLLVSQRAATWNVDVCLFVFLLVAVKEPSASRRLDSGLFGALRKCGWRVSVMNCETEGRRAAGVPHSLRPPTTCTKSRLEVIKLFSKSSEGKVSRPLNDLEKVYQPLQSNHQVY